LTQVDRINQKSYDRYLRHYVLTTCRIGSDQVSDFEDKDLRAFDKPHLSASIARPISFYHWGNERGWGTLSSTVKEVQGTYECSPV
jgi:hypothetical protein